MRSHRQSEDTRSPFLLAFIGKKTATDLEDDHKIAVIESKLWRLLFVRVSMLQP
ncbi:MAG: hypothetical protein AAFO04_21420 [Cyanobacteria bacterium J06592_8]